MDHATQSDLVTSGALDVQIPTSDMSDNAKARSRMVFYALFQLLEKSALQLLMGVENGNGYEAWRMLKRELEPASGTRQVAQLGRIIAPNFPTELQAFWKPSEASWAF